MFSGNKTKVAAEDHMFSKAWEKTGANIYRIHGEKAAQAVEEQARRIEHSCLTEARVCEQDLSRLDDEREKMNRELETELKDAGTTEEKAKSKLRGAVFRLTLACLMVLVGICIIAWSMGPSFYGHERLWLIVSAGSGLLIFVCMETLLKFLEKILNPRQFSVFNALAAAVMVAFFFAGFVQMSQARAMQMRINQQVSSDSMIYEQDMADIEKLKGKLNNLSERAMVFLFIGFEWLTGVFFYLAARTLGRFGPIVKLIKRRDRMDAERSKLTGRKAVLEKADSQSIEPHLRNGVEKERNGGSVPLMVAVIVIILGVFFGAVLLTGKAFGEEPTYYLTAYDVTGSTDHDQRENQRAIIRIINSLQPGDEFQLMNITQDTFSNPEYMIHHRMPSRAGYFREEIRRHRLRLVNEFRSMCEKLSKSRPATSLLDGLMMFGHILQERPGMGKRLIIISDMLQFARGLNPEKIAADGSVVLMKLKAEGLIPDMGGIEVYVMGASTSGIDAKTWLGVKRFWIEYFREAGACLKCYSIQRHWPME